MPYLLIFVKTFPLSHGPSVGMAWHQANCSSVKIVIAGLERVLLRCNAAVMEHFVGEEQVVLSLRVQQQIDVANVCNVCETVPGLVIYSRLHYCFLPNSIFCPTLGGATHSAPLLAVLPWQRAPKSSVCRGGRGWKSVIWGDGGKHVFFFWILFFLSDKSTSGTDWKNWLVTTVTSTLWFSVVVYQKSFHAPPGF